MSFWGATMESIGFYEARTRLSELLDQVEKGKQILITRRGKPAAILAPPTQEKSVDVRQIIDELKAYSKTRALTLGGSTAREMIEEGRRF